MENKLVQIVLKKCFCNLKLIIMKKINKLRINPDRIMKNEELFTLRGGYDGGGYVNCGESGPHCRGPINSCDDETVRLYCNIMCPGWSGAVCVG